MAPGALNHEYRNQSDLYSSILGKHGSQSSSYTFVFAGCLDVLHHWDKLLFLLLFLVSGVLYYISGRTKKGNKKNEDGSSVRLAEQRQLKEFFLSAEFGPTYLLPSLTTSALRWLAIPFIFFGFPLLPFSWATGLILFLIAGCLIFFASKIVKDQVRIEDGIFFRFARGRKIIEFDLRSIEEWSMYVGTDSETDSFTGAMLCLKSRFSKKPLRISSNDNNTLFIDMLTMLHKDKRNLASTNPALLEPKFPESETEIRQLLKNW